MMEAPLFNGAEQRTSDVPSRFRFLPAFHGERSGYEISNINTINVN